VKFNDVTKDASFYTTTSRFVTWFGVFSPERQVLWMSKDDLRDSSSWSSSPLLFLRYIHSYQEDAPLSIPYLNHLHEASIVWGEDASNADVTVIPSHHRVTLQILSHWQSFRDLKLMFTGSRRAEQLSLRSQQRVVATVEDSVFRTEMVSLESQKEDDPKRLLHYKPMSYLGKIRPHRRDEIWSASL
jgi:hypothetical protein